MLRLSQSVAPQLCRPIGRFTAVATIRRVASIATITPCNRVTVNTYTPTVLSHSSFSTAAESHSDFARQSKSRVSSGIEDAKSQIQKDISTHEVFLYMKGTPNQPKCGFSANVVKILNAYPGVKFGSRDVLEDEYVREAIKQFSDWPTLPQLFVKGEFVGGSDIVGNMYKSGELDKLLGASPKKQ